MSATINWSVTSMDCYPSVDNKTNVVFNCHWTCSGVQDVYSASIKSTRSVPFPNGSSFTAYEDLTQEQVLGWIWENNIDRAATEAAVQNQINSQINPTVVTLPLPWTT